MEEDNRRLTIEGLEDKLQEEYKTYITERSNEYMEKKLTGRLVIDFSKGKIQSIQDQAIVAGVSMLMYYSERILT